MSNRNRSGDRPSMWAVGVFLGSSVFLLGALVLMIADVSPL